jgi:DNA-directed RNA polymerase specialized sigma24 family protein
MTATPLPEATLRRHVEDPTALSRLRALVRRRVPERDAEDVVQTVVCDALASASKPERDSDVPRWIAGIAHHKVADYHRRGARELLDPDAADARGVPPAPHEARDVLERIRGEAAASPEQARTLDWVVREHDGEELRAIAVAERLAPTLVRKRVSRLRIALRSRFAKASLAFVLLLGAGTAVGEIAERARGANVDEPRIAAEPSASPAPTAAPSPSASVVHQRALGTWKVAKVVRLDIPDPHLRELATKIGPGATVTIEERRAVLVAAPASTTLTLTTAAQGGEVTYVLTGDRGPVLRGTGRLEPSGELRVRFKSGPNSGEVLLERVAR